MKPPMISDEQVVERKGRFWSVDDSREAQRDADMAWFRKGISKLEVIEQAKAEVAREINKKVRAEHKSLEALSRACFIFLRRLDEVMKDAKGNPIEAGKTIAALANALEMANDKARYFNLGVDYRKDDKDKEWQSLKSKYTGGKK